VGVTTVTTWHGGLDMYVAMPTGVGIDPAARAGGLGMTNMRARAQQLGGQFTVQHDSSGRTHLEWRIPLDSGASKAPLVPGGEPTRRDTPQA
jgi:glucose-6-phosphate-specific signal transduction histidine kinase